jgi:hypothetical protein
VINGRPRSRGTLCVRYAPVMWDNPLVASVVAVGLAKVGNGFDRIRTGTKVFVWRYPTCG